MCLALLWTSRTRGDQDRHRLLPSDYVLVKRRDRRLAINKIQNYIYIYIYTHTHTYINIVSNICGKRKLAILES